MHVCASHTVIRLYHGMATKCCARDQMRPRGLGALSPGYNRVLFRDSIGTTHFTLATCSCSILRFTGEATRERVHRPYDSK